MTHTVDNARFEFGRLEYAGIGSRQITGSSSRLMMLYACCMAMMGAKLRSGGASGNDTSFETGARIAYDALSEKFDLPPGAYAQVMDIFLPFNGFNGRQVNSAAGYHYHPSKEAENLAAQYHPGWSRMGTYPRAMMSRNSLQVMGASMSAPARFVVCETADGAYTGGMTTSKTGGTGQAIRIASALNVPVYNASYPAHRQKMENWISDAEIKIQERLGLSPTALVDDFIAQYVGIGQRVEGNLIQLANQGHGDVIVHGTNCFKMNSGVAKEIRETFPQAYEAFLKGKPGDRKRLGTIDVVKIDVNNRPLTIMNAYVQYKWGRDPDVAYVDVEALRKSFKAIAKAVAPDQRILIPRIGAGLGNGCWVSLSNIIRLEMINHDLTLVDYDGSELINDPVEPGIRKPEPADDQLSLI